MTSDRDRDPAVWAFAEHEHRDLARGINRIHDVACEVGQAATPELSVHLLEVLDWLDSTLAPHISWEEAWLYPEIDARIGTPWATRAARFDHRQIRAMATHLRADHDLLRGAQGGDRAETRCHLFSLEALVRAHLEREERVLIPLLEAERSPRDTDRPAEPIQTRL